MLGIILRDGRGSSPSTEIIIIEFPVNVSFLVPCECCCLLLVEMYVYVSYLFTSSQKY